MSKVVTMNPGEGLCDLCTPLNKGEPPRKPWGSLMCAGEEACHWKLTLLPNNTFCSLLYPHLGHLGPKDPIHSFVHSFSLFCGEGPHQ